MFFKKRKKENYSKKFFFKKWRDVQFALENQRNNLDAFNREKQTVYEEYKSLESKSSELKVILTFFFPFNFQLTWNQKK